MSLKDLELTPLLISELYKDHLVDAGRQGQPAGMPTARLVQEKTMPAKATAPEKASGQAATTGTPGTPLFETPVQAPVAEPDSAPASLPFKYLGTNKKRITFIVSSPSDVFLPDAHLDWLGKMLEACRLNLGDVAIVNIAKTPATLADIKEGLHPSAIILLGTDPQAILLPINFPPFNLQQYDGMTLLNTPPPSALNQPTNEARLLKSKLWVCLQKLFNL